MQNKIIEILKNCNINKRLIISLVFLFVNSHSAGSKFQEDLLIARNSFHRAYFEEASKLFETLSHKNNDHPLIFAYLSMIDYMLFKDPISNINQARSLLNSKDSDFLFIEALLSFVQNDLAHCEKLLVDYLCISPNDPFAMHVLGFTKTDAGRPKEGLEILNELIKLHPNYFPAYNHIGYAHLKLNEPEKAIENFKHFIDNDNLNPSAYDSYAEGLSSLNKYDMAITQLTKAVLIDPEFAYGWKHLAEIHLKNDEPIFALNAYEKAKSNSKLYGEKFIKSVDDAMNEIKTN